MHSHEFPELDRGIFTISIDFELIWGTLDLFGPAGFRKACEIERNTDPGRLFGVVCRVRGFRRHGASWGIFSLDRCHAEGAASILDIVRPEAFLVPTRLV